MTFRQPVVALAIVASALLLDSGIPAHGEPGRPLVRRFESWEGKRAERYWTPARMAAAKPFPLPGVSVALPATGDTSAPDNPVLRAMPPHSSHGDGFFSRWQEPRVASQAANRFTEGVSDVGTWGCPYSSSRLVLQNADRKFPYRPVGKLMFDAPGGKGSCTASVIGPRVVVTAGHCVHTGFGGQAGFFWNFMFCPAYRNGTAKFGCWTASGVVVTPTWATGGGTFPNGADYAVLAINDQVYKGVLSRVGDVTGTLGIALGSLVGNHVHMLGYPSNLDNGNRLHEVTAGYCTAGGAGTVLYGSDMRTGSSGGPWIQNFGLRSNGHVDGLNPTSNVVVGITSYANASTALRYSGSSVFDQRLIDLLAIVCSAQSGNCT